MALCAAITGRRSSVVERTLGKGEVESSILSGGTIISPGFLRFFGLLKNFCAHKKTAVEEIQLRILKGGRYGLGLRRY